MYKKNILFFVFLFISTFLGATVQKYQIEKDFYSNYCDKNVLNIVASFDGSYQLDRWRDILAFAKTNNVKFTFFVSGVYFIPNRKRNMYVYPSEPVKKGISNVGFGGSSTEVVTRIALVNEAYNDGNDIESHLNGHFSGLHFDENTWMLEFKQFAKFTEFLSFPAHHVRFPLLAMNDKVFDAMAEYKIYSISSIVEADSKSGNKIFKKIKFFYKNVQYTILEFPITWLHKKSSHLVSMDYNFYLKDKSKSKNRDFESAKKNMIDMYLTEAELCFKENRPFFINHHFENLNNGAYWEAMKEVILILKNKYPTQFLTIADLYEKVFQDLKDRDKKGLKNMLKNDFVDCFSFLKFAEKANGKNRKVVNNE